MSEETKTEEEEPKAVFDLNAMDHVHVIFFVAFEWHDFMMVIYTEKGKHFGKARTRTYDREVADPWSGLDRKQWWLITAKDGQIQTMIENARLFVKQLVEGWGKVEKLRMNDEIIVDGPPMKAVELMEKRPWLHRKRGEEAERWMEDYRAGRLPEQLKRARKEGKEK